MNIRKTALSALGISMACFSLLAATPPGELVTHLFPHKDGEAKQNTGGNANDWIEVGRNGTVGWITYKTGGVDLSHTIGSALTLYIDKVYTGGTIKVFALTQPLTLGEMNVEGANLFYNASSPVATATIAVADEEKILRLDLGTLLNQGPFHGLVVEAAGGLRVDFGAKESPVQPLIELRHAFATAAQVQQAIDAGLAAEAAAAAAQQAADDAEGSAAAADVSATSAQGFSVLAGQHAIAAAGSATSAAGSATAAAGHEAGALTAATAAAASATTAAGHEAGAFTAAGQAAGYATAAGSSAGEAAGYATTAGGHATAAGASAGAAALHETGANNFAGQAAGYATTAGGHATAAGASAGAAAGHEAGASTYAGQASGYASAAGSSAGEASDYAAAAGTAAGSCATSAGAAAGSAHAAAASAAAAAANSTGGLPVGTILQTTNSVPPTGFVQTGIRSNYETPWSAGTASPVGRYDVAPAVLDGILYVTGGYNGSSHLSLMQAYNPATNAWTNLASMPVVNHHHTLTAAEGHLYVIAGLIVSGGGNRHDVYRYHPGSNSWANMASMPSGEGRWAHTAAYLDGKIYVFSGYNTFPGLNRTSTVWAYDILTDSWSQRANIPFSVGSAKAAAVNGKIYVTGGELSNSGSIGKMQIYDPSANSWSHGANMPLARSHHGVVDDGQRVYVLGGAGGGVFSTVFQYDVALDSWLTMLPLAQARYQFAYGLINGRIYASQGNAGGSILSSTEVYTLPKTVYLVEKN